MNLRHFLRMSRWARHPPSARRVVLVVSIVALCLAIAALDRLHLLPDWFSLPEGTRLRPRPLP